jgi:hypothetical protein
MKPRKYSRFLVNTIQLSSDSKENTFSAFKKNMVSRSISPKKDPMLLLMRCKFEAERRAYRKPRLRYKR